MEQRRLLLAFGLSLLVIVVYQEFIVRRYPAPVRQQAVEQGRSPIAPSAEVPAPIEPSPAGEVGAAPGEVPPVAIETDVYRIAITPTGARLASLALNSFKQSLENDSPPLDLVRPGQVLPVTLTLGPGSNDARVKYRADRGELVLHGSDRGAVTFAGEDANGAKLEKRYDFVGDGYTFEVTVTSGAGTGSAALLLTPIPTDRADSRGAAAQGAGIALSERRLVEKPLTDIEKGSIPLTSTSWAGFESQYFLSVVIPKSGATTGVLETVEGVPTARMEQPIADGRATFLLYAGPKDREELSKVGHDLDRALDFGWFWFIAVPLLQALRMLHKVTGNYGVAIIALTALTKLVTTPLTQTTFRNMREMQKIQPQMARIRERFKDDQVALQKEMMELYRRHRVNPFSGCLPMLLQLPIFVGLYNALSHAIELRHAHFMLWINDLSAPDRLMVAGFGIPVLTLLMGVSMLVQQWLSPQQGDPTQQRMMMVMPLIFTFMFINFPSGLVLYWLVNNVLTIGQQYAMLRSGK